MRCYRVASGPCGHGSQERRRKLLSIPHSTRQWLLLFPLPVALLLPWLTSPYILLPTVPRLTRAAQVMGMGHAFFDTAAIRGAPEVLGRVLDEAAGAAPGSDLAAVDPPAHIHTMLLLPMLACWSNQKTASPAPPGPRATALNRRKSSERCHSA